jgi:hypothetical protein
VSPVTVAVECPAWSPFTVSGAVVGGVEHGVVVVVGVARVAGAVAVEVALITVRGQARQLSPRVESRPSPSSSASHASPVSVAVECRLWIAVRGQRAVVGGVGDAVAVVVGVAGVADQPSPSSVGS